MDLFSRHVLGWATENHMRTDLLLQTLNMAWHRRKPSPGLIHHSDRGLHYAFRRIPETTGDVLHHPEHEKKWLGDTIFGVIHQSFDRPGAIIAIIM